MLASVMKKVKNAIRRLPDTDGEPGFYAAVVKEESYGNAEEIVIEITDGDDPAFGKRFQITIMEEE